MKLGPGLPMSVALHGLLFVSGISFVGSTQMMEGTEFVVIPVELVTLGPTTDIAPVDAPDPEEDTSETEEEPVPEEELPEVEPEPEPEPEPVPVEEDIAPPEPELDETEQAEEPEPEPQPEPEPEPEPDPKDTFADLLGSTEERLKDLSKERPEPRRQTSQRDLEDLGGETRRRGAGNRDAMQATVIDVIKSQIKVNGCYQTVTDLPDFERLDVTFVFQLDQRGNLKGQPRMTYPSRIPAYDRFYMIARDRALTAITRCAPFTLPPSDYELWANQDIKLNFDEQF